MKQTTRLNYLFEQCMNGHATEEEHEELLLLLSLPENETQAKALLRDNFTHRQPEQSLPPAAASSIIRNILSQEKTVPQQKTMIPRRRRLYAGVSVAAALLLCAAGIALFKHTTASHTQPATAAKAIPLAPGGSKAILTLGDGRKINLDSAGNSTLAIQDGSALEKLPGGKLVCKSPGDNKSHAIQYNMVETPRGGQYQLELTDGTQVWLNAASSIRYPSIITDSTRTVEVTGEVYFEVAPHAAKPFTVLCRGMAVQVLGTAFNVMAYPDEPAMRTTLVTGAVKLVKDHNAQLVKPGEQAVLQNSQPAFTITHPNVETVLAWKKGEFRLDGADITQIMRQLARWYDVEIVYNGAMPATQLNGILSRKKYAAEILDALELSNIVHFKTEGRKIIVFPGAR